MMEMNRKNFPGLYWLGRCFASLLAALLPMALLEQYRQLPRGPFSFFFGLGVLWVAAIWVNIPKGIAWCLDALWRIVVSMVRDAIKHIARAMRAFAAAVRLVFWPVVAVFLAWKLCELVWRIF